MQYTRVAATPQDHEGHVTRRLRGRSLHVDVLAAVRNAARLPCPHFEVEVVDLGIAPEPARVMYHRAAR